MLNTLHCKESLHQLTDNYGVAVSCFHLFEQYFKLWIFPSGLSNNGKVTVESSSFSCLQLSGVTPNHDSESLCIDEDCDAIIPSSPEAMHIDLSATPSAELDNCTSQINAEQDSKQVVSEQSRDFLE